MVELYPPETKLPPTDGSVMSVNAPPLILLAEISSTPPSKPFSKSKLWVNLSWPQNDSKIVKPSVVSRYLSLLSAGAFTHTALGAESAGGDGSPALELCHRTPSASTPSLVVHPAGSAGGVTLSKFSLRSVII